MKEPERSTPRSIAEWIARLRDDNHLTFDERDQLSDLLETFALSERTYSMSDKNMPPDVAMEKLLNFRTESAMNSCPTCGADLHGNSDWAIREAEHNLRIFSLIEEVEAMRQGVSITHVDGDPIPAVRRELGDKQTLLDGLARLRKVE